MRKKLGTILLVSALIFQCTTPVMAKETNVEMLDMNQASEVVNTLPTSQLYYGTITAIQKDKKQGITSITTKSKQYGEMIFHLSKTTVWIDGKNRIASSSSNLKVGESIYLFHSPITTRSLPPQTSAFVVIRNIPQDTMCPQYVIVDTVEKQKDGRLQITTKDGEMILLLDEETPLTPYRTKNIVGLDDIKQGDRLLVWYSIVGISYPAKVYPEHVMLLPNMN